MSSVQIKGLTALSLKFDNMKLAGREAIAEALTYEAGQVLKIANPITPKDTGALRKSGRVIAPRKNSIRNIVARVRWGGAKAPYAAYVHEMPSTFNYTTPGTGPQYAARAANQLAAALPESVAKFLRVGLKKRFPATRSKAEATVTVNLGK